jgi:hypothetical protein
MRGTFETLEEEHRRTGLTGRSAARRDAQLGRVDSSRSRFETSRRAFVDS